MKHQEDDITVVGIDPGLANLGIGAVHGNSRNAKHLDSILIKTNARMKQGERLIKLYDGVKDFLIAYKPDALAIEAQFFQPYGDIGFKVGQAYGVCLLAAQELEIEHFEYTPKHVKQAIVGTGAANKEQVTYMVRAMLELKQLKSNHVADALGLGLTHLSNRNLKKLEEASLLKMQKRSRT